MISSVEMSTTSLLNTSSTSTRRTANQSLSKVPIPFIKDALEIGTFITNGLMTTSTEP